MKNLLGRIKNLLKPLLAFNRYIILSLLLSFTFCLLFFMMLLSRYYCISQLKSQIIRVEQALNEIGWDIAYEDLQFKTWWPMDLLKVKDFQLYSLDAANPVSWKVEKLSLRPNFFDCGKISLHFSSPQTLSVGTQTYELQIPSVELNAEFTKADGLKELLLQIKDLQISGWAKISEIQFAAQRMAPLGVSSRSPFMESHLLIKNVVFNASREVALTGTIARIYLNANMIGAVQDTGSFRTSLYDWLAQGGRFDIRSLIINWKPLLLIGRGELYFNEKLQPHLHMATSSKALLAVLDLLERQNLLNRKGYFVAKILLANKAFKLSPQDDYTTVVTPMDYKEGRFSVENITVFGNEAK